METLQSPLVLVPAALGALAGILALLLGPGLIPRLVAWWRRRRRAQPPPSPRAPGHLPPGPDPFFVDREADVDAIVQGLLVPRPLPALALHGSPGIGKTAIARQAVNNARVQAAFPGRVLWSDSTPETYDGLLDALARALGAADIPAKESADLKADALRGLLASEPLLLAVFNSADGPAATALDRLAAAGFPLALLATSRDLLLRLSLHEVRPLDPGAAERVFVRYAYPDDLRLPRGDAEAVRQALPLLGGVPLALQIAAGALGQRSAADLLRDLRAQPIETLSPSDPASLSVRRAFEVSWGYLPPEERRLFAALGLFAGDTSSRDAVLALMGDQPGTRDGLDRLVRASLVGFDRGAGRHSLHPLLRAYAREKQAEVALDAGAARLRLAAFLHGLVPQHQGAAYEDLSALDREWGHLWSPADGYGLLHWLAARPAEDAPAARLLVETLEGLFQYMLTRGYWAERLALAEAALPRAEGLGDEPLLTRFLGNTATFFQSRGDLDRAFELHNRALEVFQRLGDEGNVAVALHQQGMLAQGQGRLEEARGLYARSLQIEERLGDQRGMAATLHQQGILAQGQGRLEEARDLYARSLEIEERLGNQRGIAATLHQLGNVEYLQGRLEEARDLYARSLQIEERLGDQRGMAATLHQQGILAQGQGRLEEARDLYTRSLQIKERLGDQRGIASTLHQLGMLAQGQGRLEEAQGLYTRSLQIEERLGNQRGIAQSLHQMGTLAQDQGRLEEARGLYNRSLEIEERLGDQHGIAISHGQLGLLEERTGNLAEAERHFQLALEIFQRLGAPTAPQAERDLARVRAARSQPTP